MKENPLCVLYSTLEIINEQSFVSSEHARIVKEKHEKTTLELLEIGLWKEVMTLRFKANTQHLQSTDFTPKIVDGLWPTNSIVGWINGSYGSSRPVLRELLGRTFDMIIGGDVIGTEYYRAHGDQDPDLFKVAQRHEGITGIEGTVPRIIPMEKAGTLLFTPSERSGRPSEITIFDSSVGKRELVTV